MPTVTIELPDRDEVATFELQITHYDRGIYSGPMDGSYPAEIEWEVDSVSINDGPVQTPVPQDIYNAYEDALNEKAWEIADDE